MLTTTKLCARIILSIAGFIVILSSSAWAEEKKPNIVVIWGDDIGMWNVGAYTHGMMGRTPNIDSIAQRRCAVH